MTQSPHRERTDFGADPAFVASQSSRHGVSTKGFNPGEILTLAERCEQARGPDRELDALIWWEAGEGKALVPEKINAGDAIGYYYGHEIVGPNQLKGHTLKTYRGPAYTASLDATTTLVPEGCSWNLHKHSRWARAGIFVDDGRDPGHYCNAATPALALCAAALKARAAQ